GIFYTASGEFESGAMLIKDNRIDRMSRTADPAAMPTVDAESAAGDMAKDVDSIDLHGGYVIPGFADAHIHLTSLALKRLRCDLSTAGSARDVCAVLAESAAASDAPFVIGVDFDESRWENRKLPTRVMLDGVDDKRPVLARRICGHVGVANTPMLSLLETRPDLINRDTGVIKEHAVWAAGRICEPDSDSVVRSFAEAIDGLYALGITTIHDIVEENKFDMYLEGIQRARTPLRIDALVNTSPRRIERFVRRCGESPVENVRVVGAKCFLDGSIGGHTAALNADYADHAGWGTLLMRREVLEAVAGECFDKGYVLAIHAIGDRSLDLATGVLREFPPDAGCFRLEHCEVTAPAQIAGLKCAPVFLCLQPNFVRNWGGPGGLNEMRLGSERNRWCNAYRTLLDTGKRCIFGSDGMPPGPLYGIKGAIDHPVTEERMSPREAIECYASTAHSLAAHKRAAGSLEPGNLADLAVLNANPLTVDPDVIQVTMTFVDGEIVYDGAGGAGA
ncbi:MAG: amidohydrolase family protein, partial [bacterium]